jgi:hypothetical protein
VIAEKIFTWLIFTSVIAESAFPMGDARMRVSGEITDEAGKVHSLCRVELLEPVRKSWLNPEKILMSADYRIDYGKLATFFTISPHVKEAVFEIYCRGASKGYRSQTFSLDESRDIDLGHIVIERSNGVTFQEAICSRNLAQTRLALSKGENPNTVFTEGIGKGHTPLTLALASHDCPGVASVDLVSLLVENGADVNQKPETRVHDAPLLEAVQSLNVQLVEYLLAHGADANSRNVIGQTPLMAYYRDSSDRPLKIVVALLKAGADPDARSDTGDTPEGWARSWDRPDIAELIRRAKEKKQ